MKVTIGDVAKDAGVSIATVSRVINNNYPVSKKTRSKVEESIKKLNFTPDFFGKGLMDKKTYSIGVLVPTITNPYFPSIVEAIERYMIERGFSILLCDTLEDSEQEKKYVQTLMDRHVDGIIVVEGGDDNRMNGFFEEIAKKIPLVLINGYHKGVRANYVMSDQELGAFEALEYLIGMGHRDILFARGVNAYSYDIKEQVYKDVLQKHNIPVDKDNIVSIDYLNKWLKIDSIKESIMKRLEKKLPTAIFACNDIMALGALYAAKSIGVQVPKELSIIGHDNIILSHVSDPKLTTVDLNMNELGLTAAEMMLDIIENNTSKIRKVILDTKLIIRDSCSPI